MLHLFDRVYLVHHGFIDIHSHRAVISNEHGFPILESIGAKGELIAYGTTFSGLFQNGVTSFTDLLEKLKAKAENTGEQVIVYCDGKNYEEFVARWFRSLLPHASVADVLKFMKSHTFKSKLLHSRPDFERRGAPIDLDAIWFEKTWNNLDKGDLATPTFIKSVHDSVSVEFQLATYLATGALDTELKKHLIPLVRRDAENWLCELKEFICAHIMNDSLQEALGVTKAPTLDTLDSFVDNAAPPYDVLFDVRLWPAPLGGSVDLSAVTNNDIDKIRKTIEAFGTLWPEERDMYLQEVNGVSRLDILGCLNKSSLSDGDLDAILAFEGSGLLVLGFFDNLYLGTVNNYFIGYILKQKAAGNEEAIKPYRLVK